ncbi:BFD domain protein (2Fe-2S)-binding domain protein [Methylocella silvestris BL2]|uniref:Bacterioferritin-associated ferredoxin n=2 Tax=Methylocella silvestris TaxID=199596 RepID=B8ETF2_METSB|nr:BFD domain protein (2Fe-2S)-binding domain protein [Methylocella silvestris BL2]
MGLAGVSLGVSMIVCSCNVLSDMTIKSAVDAMGGAVSPRTPTAVYKCLGCSPNCGRCFRTVRKIINEALDARRLGGHGHGSSAAHEHDHAECDPNCPGPCRADNDFSLDIAIGAPALPGDAIALIAAE